MPSNSTSNIFIAPIEFTGFPFFVDSGHVRLFSVHMDWRGLIRIRGDFDLGLVRLRRIAPGIVPVNQSLYKLEK
jgi:hypothetical protein